MSQGTAQKKKRLLPFSEGLHRLSGTRKERTARSPRSGKSLNRALKGYTQSDSAVQIYSKTEIKRCWAHFSIKRETKLLISGHTS